MNNSITNRIFIIFIGYTLALFLMIAISVKFFLPSYYEDRKISEIQDAVDYIQQNLDDANEINLAVDQLIEDVGGDLYLIDENGVSLMGGRGKGRMTGNSFSTTDELVEYTYTNSLGYEMYYVGIPLEEEYIVYEVLIESFSKATDLLLDFVLILLLIGLAAALVVSYLISIGITRPIRRLNRLAMGMRERTQESEIVVEKGKELVELNESLNQLNDELSGNIYRLEAELMKEKASEQLSKTFIANVSHELKTPLTIISGYSELLSEGLFDSPEEMKEMLSQLQSESVSLSYLIQDLIDYSKIETKNFEITKEAVDLKLFIHDVSSKMKMLMGDKQLEIIDETKKLVHYMDPLRVEQIIKNLINNASEHAKKKVTLTFRTEGTRLSILVSNDGEEIAEEDLPYLFDQFYKRKGKQSGTGMGLAIVKGITLKHGGQYFVKNEEGVTFGVLL